MPKFVKNAPPTLVAHSRARTFMLIAEQTFNYDTLGADGFKAVGDLVSATSCYQFSYSSLDDAAQTFDRLLEGNV